MQIRLIDAETTLPVRHAVLWPDKPRDFCRVVGDDAALHFGGFLGDRLVSVASIFFDDTQARLRKFATLEAYQGRGFGSQMLNHILAELAARGIDYFWCDARATASNFYQRFGLNVESEQFEKSGVAYFKMGRAIASTSHTPHSQSEYPAPPRQSGQQP